MTTIEEIENEIAALKEAREIIEERTGNQCFNDLILIEIDRTVTLLNELIEVLKERQRMDLPVNPYEPEFEKD